MKMATRFEQVKKDDSPGKKKLFKNNNNIKSNTIVLHSDSILQLTKHGN